MEYTPNCAALNITTGLFVMTFVQPGRDPPRMATGCEEALKDPIGTTPDEMCGFPMALALNNSIFGGRSG
jgi:hypothetical protein